jgi:hypothetical protein
VALEEESLPLHDPEDPDLKLVHIL